MKQFYEYSIKPIAELAPYAKNSRTHSKKQVNQIAASMKEFGWTNPVLIDDKGGIIAGHGRILAAKEISMTEVPCITITGLTAAQKRALVISDNKLALNAGWDTQLLSEEIGDLKDDGYDISILGFEDDELADLLEDEKKAGLVEDDEVPDLAEVPITKPGDVWVMGPHRLHCGDSTSIDAVNKLVNGQLVDQLITDPPYNVAYEGKTKDALKIKNDSMADDKFRQFLRDAFTAANTVMKPGAVFYIWHADSEGYNFRGACKDTDWKVRKCLIWNKSAMVMGRQDYHWKHEPCLYGWKEGAGHLWATDRKQTSVIECDRPSRSESHPTMKPVALFEYQMLNNTKGGDIVLDLFGGSGTTLIAAEKNGRRAYLMELDPKYCDVILKRFIAWAGQQPVLESTGQTFEEVSKQ